jgi:hypothetical protein
MYLNRMSSMIYMLLVNNSNSARFKHISNLLVLNLIGKDNLLLSNFHPLNILTNLTGAAFIIYDLRAITIIFFFFYII